MKALKALTTTLISIGAMLVSLPAKAELPPQTVINGVYAGIQHIHGYQATPRLVWGVARGYRSSCGPIYGSQYCTRNHTVYITSTDIRMAYQHGDAALAYIVGHEYAHAMQTVYGFQPSVTPISELQADCLAGVYLGLIPNITFDKRDILEIATLAHRIGDYEWGNEHHHGTPEQRVQAVVQGLRGAANGSGVRACRVRRM
ncbi:neutral zinc metallopeptidase [Brasilonema sp. UFV-L1]|uniref:neutral zinc metallopeptidase n=1 Tax=Brasilonema sp. UFV-L1 TaxID=2234130 RepID=UPI00145EABD3|nr:neutral zinc metallopeptidase [Brasilonema sp. UFV-L1]NMG08346.1 metalloprotease [Brasilonema sp. UFV-L1]